MLPTTLPFLYATSSQSVEGETFKSMTSYASIPFQRQNTTSKMGVSQKWFRIFQGRFLRSSNNDIILPRTSVCTNESQEAILRNEAFNSPTPIISPITKEDVAATKIQAYFRGHLARRAYRALKSLVKLQALVRGVWVRKQSRIAMQCMHALVRLQVRVRARQLLGGFDKESLTNLQNL